MTTRWPPLELARGSGSPSSSELQDGTTPVPPVSMGEIVDEKYRIDGVIGFGGMGVVCSATHLELHTSVAIKFLRPERGLNDRASSRFLTEARAAAQLKSQHACRVMDCGRLPDGTPYIVMEQLEGSDLRTLLDERGPLPIADAIAYAVQACEALAEAHAKHIVHRDVKPENLFLTKGPSGSACLKVLDFGISKQVGPLRSGRSITEPTENMGSPFYMSPEQMIDPAGVDSRTDIWALGVVTYELLTGQLPFSGETTPQLCANVMTTQPLSPREHRAEISENLARILLRCIEKDRTKRFANASELATALEQVDVEQVEPAAVLSTGEVSRAAIAGLPQRGSSLRVGVVAVLVAAGLLAALAVVRSVGLRKDVPEPNAEVSASVPKEAPPVSQSAAAPAPSASVSPATSSKPSKLKRHVASTSSVAPSPVAPPVAPEPPPDPPVVDPPLPSASPYPLLKPIPDMPVVAPPTP